MEPNKTHLKKLLFLYAVKEYFWRKPWQQPLIGRMNTVINERYRKKGFEINFLVFDDREVASLVVEKGDKVLKSDIKLSPIIEKRLSVPNTDNNLIQKLLMPVDELVVCGFHEIDCVRKVARHFSDQGVDTLVDIEVTDRFGELSKLASFKPDNYNLADIMECKFAAAIHKNGEGSYVYCPGTSMYDYSPYYKMNTFTPTHTWQEWLEIIKEKEKAKYITENVKLGNKIFIYINRNYHKPKK